MAESVRLILGDSLEQLRTIETGSINHVITDPPYGQSNESYDRGVDPAVWRECYRVTGPDAALVSFAGGPTYHRIAGDIEAAGWKVRQMWGWIYRDGFITSAYPKEGFDRLAPAMDPICYATKGKVILDLEREGDYGWDRAEGRRNLSDKPGFSLRASSHGLRASTGRWPRSIVASEGIDGFQYFVLSRTRGGHSPEKTGHPNQKPIELMEWIVGKLPGSGPILDPYAGSATTLMAAYEAGRSAIGIERDPSYFAIASRRIADAQSATPLLTG